MMMPRQRRPGFRLVDLIVAIVLVVILIGLLMPATVKVIDDGARTRCINNLKQITLGVHNYASAYQNILPPLTTHMAKPKYGVYNGGILFALLPFVEQGILLQNGLQLLPSATWAAPIPPNTTLPFTTTPPGSAGPPLYTWPLRHYQCMADATISNELSNNQTSTNTTTAPFYFPWAASSYSANYLVFGTENNFGDSKSGNFCGPKFNIGNIPDGSSNTVFFGEQFAACGTSSGNLWAYPGIGDYSGSQYTSAVPGQALPCGAGTPALNGGSTGHFWAPVFANANPTYGYQSGGTEGSIFKYNTATPAPPIPLAPPYAVCAYWDAPPQTGIVQAECDKSRLQSFHTNIVCVAMGDGSVRLVSGTVSQATWYSAICPDDGIQLGSDW